MFPDLLILREPSGLEFRENLFAIDADFETAAIRGNEDQSMESAFQVIIIDESFGQTDRLGLIASDLAVNDLDFHHLFSLMPSSEFFN